MCLQLDSFNRAASTGRSCKFALFCACNQAVSFTAYSHLFLLYHARLQLESFNRAASTGRSSSGKFARLFSARKSPKTPGGGSVAASPARSVDNGAGAGLATPSSAPSMSLDDMLVYQNVRPHALNPAWR